MNLQKRIYQIQTDMATAQTQFQEASDKLEETNKQLTAVSIRTRDGFTFRSHLFRPTQPHIIRTVRA